MPESPLSPTAARQTSAASSLLSHTDTGAAERRDNGDSCSGVSVENWQSLHHKQAFLAMMAPQQMQQLLSPNQLQVLIQQKQQALLLQQQHLKEFYKAQQHVHLQLLQQQPSKKVKSELPAQHLVFQQLLQLQQQQQQLLQVQRPILTSPALSPVGFSPADVQLIWNELTNALTEDKPKIKSDDHNSFANCVISTKVQLPPQSQSQSPSPRRPECADLAASHVLYSHGVCTWPGCESVCENLNQFIKHIDSEHTLDDRSTAQCRVQMQVVEQLELQLCKERQCLRAMMSHLHLPSLETRSPSITSQHSPKSDKAADPRGLQLSSVSVGSSLTSVNPSDSAQIAAQRLAPVNTSPRGCEEESHADCVGAVRRRRQPLVYSLSSENEYELYKNTDIRPPFTYATLIRQAIMEASDMQLTLNEIYNWFTRTFAYFRRNAATWKNAVRHNLSLHKCFVRVENVKGAVWTVDEVEYQRRRSQKITGSPLVIQNMSSNMTFGTGLNCGSQTTLMEASLPGLKKENKATNGNSHSNQNASLQVQRSVFLKDEMMHLNDQEPLMLTGTRVDLRHDRSENDEAHVFDLE